MLLVTLLLLCAGVLSTKPVLDKSMYNLDAAKLYFADFVQKYNRQYADETEMEKRFVVFTETLKNINTMNMDDEEKAVFGITEFADLETDEFNRVYTGLTPECRLLANRSQTAEDINITECKIEEITGLSTMSVPDKFDWRDRGVVTRVKNQKTCGSCWTFGTTGNIEGQYAIKYKQLLELSEQQLIDCDKVNHGCKGGLLAKSFGGLIDIGGIMAEKDYPYSAQSETCKFDASKTKVKLTGCITYDIKDEEKLKELLYTVGPIAIAIDAGCMAMKTYVGGEITKYGCKSREPNHAVLLVGYDEKNWIIKNSWGPGWGEDGYYSAVRGKNTCSMLNPCGGTAIIA